MLVNKIGDMFLVAATALFAGYGRGSTEIATALFSVVSPALEDRGILGTGVDTLALCLVTAAFVKSAQIFFHTWLADAMEGPTPVSALLHAATMVTAGVYLVVRFSPIIEFSPLARAAMFFVGFYTIVMSSLIALAQYDIKKIIAYSTCSQLGLMFFSCGLSGYDFALYHFFNHAFFKCLLFLLAGVIIHQLRNEQDIRKMGGLAAKMPTTYTCFLIATMSLVGMPGFSGATSKDMILHLVNFIAGQSELWAVKIFLFSTNIIIYLTMAYAVRLFYYVFLGPANYNKRYFTPRYRDVAFQEKIYAVVFLLLAQ
jgi:NADH-quinone oxidoreductase subunit L